MARKPKIRKKGAGSKTPTGKPFTRTGDAPNAQQLRAIDRWFANGFKMNEALKYAGYAETVQHNPQTVFARDQVRMEIERRQKKLANEAQIDQAWVIRRLARIADSGEILAKFRTVGDKGDITWDFTGATNEDLAVIADLTVETYTEGRGDDAQQVKRIKVGVTDPKGALDSIAKILGFMTDRVKHEGEISVVDRLLAGRNRVKRPSGEK